MPVTFAIYRGGQLIRRETLTQPVVKIGKDSRSHLRIDDERASRMHAVVEVTEKDEMMVIDLGSEGGTLVNGQRVNKAKLRVGDHVQIGGTTLVLETPGAPAFVPELAEGDPHRGALGAALARIEALEEENRTLRGGGTAPTSTTACPSCGGQRTRVARLVHAPGKLKVGTTQLELAHARVCADCGHVALLVDEATRAWLREHDSSDYS